MSVPDSENWIADHSDSCSRHLESDSNSAPFFVEVVNILHNYLPRWLMIVAALPKAWTVFSRLDAGIISSNSTQGMDICVCVYSVFVLFCVRQRPCDGVINRPRSSTVCIKKDYEIEKETRAQKTCVEPLVKPCWQGINLNFRKCGTWSQMKSSNNLGILWRDMGL
jgi:hypothetical protein